MSSEPTSQPSAAADDAWLASGPYDDELDVLDYLAAPGREPGHDGQPDPAPTPVVRLLEGCLEHELRLRSPTRVACPTPSPPPSPPAPPAKESSVPDQCKTPGCTRPVVFRRKNQCKACYQREWAARAAAARKGVAPPAASPTADIAAAPRPPPFPLQGAPAAPATAKSLDPCGALPDVADLPTDYLVACIGELRRRRAVIAQALEQS